MSKSMCVSFVFFVVLYLFALGFVVDFLWLLKVTPIIILGVGVFATQPSTTRSILLLALIFSACGDLLLAFDLFIYGVGAFLLAQLSYAFMFKSYWKGIAHRWPLSVLLIGGMLTMVWLLIPHLGDLKIPVMAYLCAIGAMGLLATQSSLPMRWPVLGAILFIISDSFIAINKFVFPVPFEAYWIMGTYYGAQYMLVTGFLNSIKTKAA